MDYPPPVDRLLTFGSCQDIAYDTDYLALGLTPEHVPDLIRMATDEVLYATDAAKLESWAPNHAWRALGQLRAEAAVEPLLGLLHHIDDDDDDWIGEELPDVFTQIGPVAVQALARYLANPDNTEFARVAATRSIQQIGSQYPASLPACSAVLTSQLERFSSNGAIVNAFLISGLVDLKAIEAAPVMERAFAANAVDLPVGGDWEDVQIDLGIKKTRDTPRRNYVAEQLGLPADFGLPRAIERYLARERRKTSDPWEEAKRKAKRKKRKH